MTNMTAPSLSKPVPIYTANAIRDWETHWLKSNDSFGLMQQASLLMAHHIITILEHRKIHSAHIVVWCGTGNNGGDGYCVATLLQELLDNKRFALHIIAPNAPTTLQAQRAKQALPNTITDIPSIPQFEHWVHIDALFGNGLTYPLQSNNQKLIHQFNRSWGLKIAIDLPSGLCPNTGMPLPVCTQVEETLSLIGGKLGTFIGVAKQFVGHITHIPLLPTLPCVTPCAYLSTYPSLPVRPLTAHKGTFGTVAIIGGHAHMGGAVALSASAVMAVGAGKATVICHQYHHTAILANQPALMVADICEDHISALDTATSICFGMGLGRDEWSYRCYHKILPYLLANHNDKPVVLDADALWFLAHHPQRLPDTWIATPHHAEAGRLLNMTAKQIEQDTLTAINALKDTYGANWVLKGANSLSVDGHGVFVCPYGNAGMATAGMGDVLSGVIAGILAWSDTATLADCVCIHALAGDHLAKNSPIGMSATDMPRALKYILANSPKAHPN